MNYASHCCTSALLHNTHSMKKRPDIVSGACVGCFMVLLCSHTLFFFMLCSLCTVVNVQYVLLRSSVYMWIEFLCVLLIDSEKHAQHLESKTCFPRVLYHILWLSIITWNKTNRKAM